MPSSERQDCPSCGAKGKPVKPITVETLVAEDALARAARADGFRFCATPSCDVAYFHPEDGHQVARSEVRVRIGQKETTAPRPVCYCFDHTVEEIEADVAATGTSPIAESITAKCRQGLDRCEETNPQGSCCLGNVRRALREAQARIGGPPATAGVSADDTESCCAATPAPARRSSPTGLLATGGAMLSAILSSACCWLPLLLIAFGASKARCADVYQRAEAKIQNIDEKIQTLEAMRRALSKLMCACAGRGAITECPILDALDEDDH